MSCSVYFCATITKLGHLDREISSAEWILMAETVSWTPYCIHISSAGPLRCHVCSLRCDFIFNTHVSQLTLCSRANIVIWVVYLLLYYAHMSYLYPSLYSSYSPHSFSVFRQVVGWMFLTAIRDSDVFTIQPPAFW